MFEFGKNKEAVDAVCRDFEVLRLQLFGSAATEWFDPDESDVDFLVEFKEGISLGPWLSRLTEFKEALRDVVGHGVDVVTSAAMRDEHFRNLAAQTLCTVYDGGEVAEVAG